MPAILKPSPYLQAVGDQPYRAARPRIEDVRVSAGRKAQLSIRAGRVDGISLAGFTSGERGTVSLTQSVEKGAAGEVSSVSQEVIKLTTGEIVSVREERDEPTGDAQSNQQAAADLVAKLNAQTQAANAAANYTDPYVPQPTVVNAPPPSATTQPNQQAVTTYVAPPPVSQLPVNNGCANRTQDWGYDYYTGEQILVREHYNGEYWEIVG